jgi:hypothetical protein
MQLSLKMMDQSIDLSLEQARMIDRQDKKLDEVLKILKTKH